MSRFFAVSRLSCLCTVTKPDIVAQFVNIDPCMKLNIEYRLSTRVFAPFSIEFLTWWSDFDSLFNHLDCIRQASDRHLMLSFYTAHWLEHTSIDLIKLLSRFTCKVLLVMRSQKYYGWVKLKIAKVKWSMSATLVTSIYTYTSMIYWMKNRRMSRENNRLWKESRLHN